MHVVCPFIFHDSNATTSAWRSSSAAVPSNCNLLHMLSPYLQMVKSSQSLSRNAQIAVLGPCVPHPMQGSLMLCDHQPEETKHCKVTEIGGAHGTQEMLLRNKHTLSDRKKLCPIMPPGHTQGVLSSLFLHNAFQKVDPSFLQLLSQMHPVPY